MISLRQKIGSYNYLICLVGIIFYSRWGGGSVEKAYNTACTLLRHMNVIDVAPIVCSHKTNDIPSFEDVNAMKSSKDLAVFFNETD